MPRNLFSSSDWRLLCIDREQARCGDLLFVGSKDSKRLITHGAIVLGANRIFHCTRKLGTAAVQTDGEFFANYAQKFNFKQLVSYIDGRNEALRAKNGIYLKA